MDKYNFQLLGWDEKTDKIINAKQTGFMCKGERECLDLILSDGRKITCTGNHRLLTSTNKWTTVDELKVGIDKIKCSVTYPLMKIDDDIICCNNWKLKIGDIILTTNTNENYLKTLAFIRIISYMLADGGIYYHKIRKEYRGHISVGHEIDLNNVIVDLELFMPPLRQYKFKCGNFYKINVPEHFIKNIIKLKGIVIGAKIKQPAQLPDFILDPACPKPIIREFLGGLFGADGHTCVLGMHRGKRDILSSISFSKTKTGLHLESLTKMMEDIKSLFAKFNINGVTIQNFKQTTNSKKKSEILDENRSYQLTLHLDINELIPFSEKIGFRYCCHKSQRLEAGVTYKRLRNEVTRQHNWLVNRVDELTHFSEIKKETPNKIVHTKDAILRAVEELKVIEPLIHEYAVPSTHDITDHLIKGTQFGAFRGKGFPTAEEFLKEIGALDWFLTPENKKEEIYDVTLELFDEEPEETYISYGVNRDCEGLPTMELKIIDIRPAGVHPVYDIEVENTHSFLANGIVAHNCMVSHGAARFTRGRMYDASDKYSVFICKKCGLIASYNDQLHIHHCRVCDNRADFAYVEIPYACKLLFQELNTMNIAPRLMTEH
jgi:intein/homing endonuclease